MSRSRSWCITFYKEPVLNDSSDATTPSPVRYSVFGKEICPKTGRDHWHSYTELKTPQRMAFLKKLFNDNTIHCETRKGTREEAKAYCQKDGDFFEIGDWKAGGQGNRTDLKTIVSTLQSGTTLSEIMTTEPDTYCRYRNGLRDIASVIAKNKAADWRTLHVEFICGPTDSGKTRYAMAQCESPYKIQGSHLAWWEDYEGEDAIVIDEYDNDIRITELLALLDGYKLRLNVKGSHTYANWTKVYITSNLTPEELHSQAKNEHRNALLRRINVIKNFWNEVNLERSTD